ncbi:MAG: DsrE family protein [Caldilineales bacterium]
MGQVMIHLSRGKEDVERATLAFVVANAGLTAGQDSTILLTLDAVWLATPGYTDGMEASDFAPLSNVISGYIAGGGKVWVCGACCKPRGITASHLMEGATMVGAVAAVEALVGGAQTLSF